MKHQMPPTTREIIYSEPFLMARRLRGERELMLLESVQRHEHLGRYSFLAVDPTETIVSNQADVLDVIDEHLKKHARAVVPNLPPFRGGLAGYITYDFGRTLEPKARIKNHTSEIPLLKLNAYPTVIAIDHLQERSWIISDSEKSADDLEKLLKQKPSNLSAHQVSNFTSNFSQENYEAAVQRTVDYILAGDIFQANITQIFSSDAPKDFDAFAFYKILRDKNPATFSSLLDFDDVKLISSSPERLIRLNGKIAEARPIKGTKRRDDNPQRDAELIAELQASRKDRAENVMIVDLLRNDLSRVSKPGTVNVPVLCGLESYANVHHLVSVVTGELQDGLNQVDLLRAVFPGGSITGAPKIRAMEIIDELEQSPRGVYCGAIGYLGYNGTCDFNIAIRTVQVAGGKVKLQGGGGITARSDPAAEYEESLVKVKRIMEAFQS